MALLYILVGFFTVTHYLGDVLEDFGWIGGWESKFSPPIFPVKFQYVKVVIFNVFLQNQDGPQSENQNPAYSQHL